MIFGKYINRYYLRSAPVLLLGLLALAGALALCPVRVAGASAPEAGAPEASEAQSAGQPAGGIGTGPYLVFAVSGGLVVVWLGIQAFKGLTGGGKKGGE